MTYLRHVFFGMCATLLLGSCTTSGPVSPDQPFVNEPYRLINEGNISLLSVIVPVPSSFTRMFPVGTGTRFTLDAPPPGQPAGNWQEEITLTPYGFWDTRKEYWFGWYLLHTYAYHQDRLPDPRTLNEDTDSLYEVATLDPVTGQRDPYTNYFTPQEGDYLEKTLTGVETTYKMGFFIRPLPSDSLVVGSVVAGAPAARMGLRRDDRIVAIDGDTDVLTRLASYRDSLPKEHSYTVVRPSIGERLTLKGTSAVVNYPPVWWDTLSGGVGYIRIISFESGDVYTTDSLFRVGMDELRSEVRSSKGWILDLRDDGGGTILSAQRTASHLLPAGDSLVRVSYRTMDPLTFGGVTKDSVMRVVGSIQANPLPGTIHYLQNELTASASEILLSALRSNLGSDRFQSWGDTTFGKGIGQLYMYTPLGGYWAFTLMYFDPLRDPRYHHVGIAPDHPVGSSAALLSAWNAITAPSGATRSQKKGIGSTKWADSFNNAQFTRKTPPLQEWNNSGISIR